MYTTNQHAYLPTEPYRLSVIHDDALCGSGLVNDFGQSVFLSDPTIPNLAACVSVYGTCWHWLISEAICDRDFCLRGWIPSLSPEGLVVTGKHFPRVG